MSKPKLQMRVSVELTGWEFYDGAEALSHCIKLVADKGDKSVSFEIDEEALDKACQQIASKAIETFFGDDAEMPAMTDEGLKFIYDDYEKNILISYDQIFLDLTRKGRDTLIKRLQTMKFEGEESADQIIGTLA